MKVALKPNEVVVKAGDSNQFVDNNKIQGKLILTNQRIYFKTTNSQINVYNLEIIPSCISEIQFFKTGFLKNNGLGLLTSEGQEYRFSIKNREDWCKMINKMN